MDMTEYDTIVGLLAAGGAYTLGIAMMQAGLLEKGGGIPVPRIRRDPVHVAVVELGDDTKLVEALRERARREDEYYEHGGDVINDAADAIEALQAELIRIYKQLPKRGEIVRCGECKYHLPETERTNPYCNRFHCMRTDDWFCADGEREVRE